MLTADVLVRLEALIDYCRAQEDERGEWEMLARILAAVRGAAGYPPELRGLYEHLCPSVEERLLRLLEEDDYGPDES